MPFKIKLYDYTDYEGNAQCIGGPQLTAEYVGGILDCYPGEAGVVNISTVGGDVYQAIAIFDAIKSHGLTDTRIDALAASAGSVIAMAGKRVIMSKYALMMIHKPMVGSGGNADDLQADINLLNVTQSRIAQIYMDKTGLDAETINSLINAVTWLTADQALELGFIDEIEDYTGAEITNLDTMLTHIKTAPVAYKQVFNKITTIQNNMTAEEKLALEKKNSGILASVMNFFKRSQIKTVTNLGTVISMAPLNVGVAVSNEAGEDMPDNSYEVTDAAGKKIKMVIKNSVIDSMDSEDKEDEDTDEDVQNAVVLNSVNLKVVNKIERAGMAKVITNQVNQISELNKKLIEVTNQLQVSNEAVTKTDEQLRAELKSEFETKGSHRSNKSVINTMDKMPDAFKPKSDYAKNIANRAVVTAKLK